MDPCGGNHKPKHAHFIFIVDPYRCKGLFVCDRDAGCEYFSLCTLVLCQRNFLLFEWDWPTASCSPGIYLLAQSIPFWYVSKIWASFGYLWFPTSKTSAAFFCLTTKVKPAVKAMHPPMPIMPHEPIHHKWTCQWLLSWNFLTSSPFCRLAKHLQGIIWKNLQSSGSVPCWATLIQKLCETHYSRLSTFATLATSFLRPVLFLHPLLAPTTSSAIGMLEGVPWIRRRTSVVIEGLCW